MARRRVVEVRIQFWRQFIAEVKNSALPAISCPKPLEDDDHVPGDRGNETGCNGDNDDRDGKDNSGAGRKSSD